MTSLTRCFADLIDLRYINNIRCTTEDVEALSPPPYHLESFTFYPGTTDKSLLFDLLEPIFIASSATLRRLKLFTEDEPNNTIPRLLSLVSSTLVDLDLPEMDSLAILASVAQCTALTSLHLNLMEIGTPNLYNSLQPFSARLQTLTLRILLANHTTPESVEDTLQVLTFPCCATLQKLAIVHEVSWAGGQSALDHVLVNVVSECRRRRIELKVECLSACVRCSLREKTLTS